MHQHWMRKGHWFQSLAQYWNSHKMSRILQFRTLKRAQVLQELVSRWLRIFRIKASMVCLVDSLRSFNLNFWIFHCCKRRVHRSNNKRRRNLKGKVFIYIYDAAISDSVSSFHRDTSRNDWWNTSYVHFIELLPGTRIPYLGFPRNVSLLASIVLARLPSNILLFYPFNQC